MPQYQTVAGHWAGWLENLGWCHHLSVPSPPQTCTEGRDVGHSYVLFERQVSVLVAGGSSIKMEVAILYPLWWGLNPGVPCVQGKCSPTELWCQPLKLSRFSPKQVNFNYKAISWFILCFECICMVYSALISIQWLREHLHSVTMWNTSWNWPNTQLFLSLRLFLI